MCLRTIDKIGKTIKDIRSRYKSWDSISKYNIVKIWILFG